MTTEPFTLPNPAGPCGSRRRRRDREAVRFLLDSRLFRRLCAAGQGAALESFRAALARHRIASGDGLPAFELTPFGFLEALGLEPPKIPKVPLLRKAIDSGESYLMTGVVVNVAKDRFKECPELQRESLVRRVEELRQATDPAVHELFDLCLTRVVSQEGFEEKIWGHLAFDYLCRYQYPEAVREQIFEFLAASLFAAGESVAGLSKMRIIKVLWDRAYERLLRSNPGERDKIQALDREMRLWTQKDFLDCEVVHHATLGWGTGGAKDRVHPAAGFTLDDEEVVRARSIAYKSALRAFLDTVHPEDLAKIRSRLDAWRPGWLVPCRTDGTFDTLLSTGELPVFTAGSPGARANGQDLVEKARES